ncbi:MAG: undecaprenyl-phosphate galactose phosphotransferase WbaP [Alphaproteobacteria bacterium]|nr:undecaprenyl-phosphate galactose phosphotransferase WbaP [Alphaproteobacteria bacterium]
MSFHATANARETKPLETKDIPVSPAPALKEAEAKLAALLAETQRDEVVYISGTRRKGERRDFALQLRWFIATDAVALLAGFVCAWGLAALINDVFWGRTTFDPLGNGDVLRLGQFLMIAAGVMLWFEHTGHYSVRMPFWLEAKKIIGALGIAMMIDGFLQFASKQDFSRLWLVSSWFFSGVALMTLRLSFRAMRRRQGLWQVPTLLIGSGPTAEDARAALKSEPSLGYEIVGQIGDLPRMFRYVGESWEELCAAHGADYVMIALDGPDLAKAELSLAQLMRENVPFSVLPPLRHMPVFGMVPHYFFNHDVMLMTRSNGLEQPMPRFIKRSFDVIVAGTALLLAAPLMLMIATVVKMDGGPAFFGHKRLGAGGKTFTCLKFRSMVLNAEHVLDHYLEANPEAKTEFVKFQKLRQDPRVTAIGKILRQMSLDELPQLLNVLTGDMSLVGPRPILAAETSHYHHDIALYFKVRPGITGLWQVSGRNNVSYAKRVRMDSWYVRNWSLWHDIAILCKTVPALFNRTGAY